MTPHSITAAMLVLCALVAIWVGWNEGEWKARKVDEETEEEE